MSLFVPVGGMVQKSAHLIDNQTINKYFCVDKPKKIQTNT
jgi:hypothetical protein